MEGIMIVDKTLQLGDLYRPPFFRDYYGTSGDDPLVVTTTDARFGNRIFAGDGDDTVQASEGRDEVYGGNNNDHLYGNGGNDYLDGGADNDFVDGGTGADTMVGGLGDDTFVVDDLGDTVSENLNEGVDEVWSSLASYDLAPNVIEPHSRNCRMTMSI
jgi:Ca2+-binding RTX toxin-like protein